MHPKTRRFIREVEKLAGIRFASVEQTRGGHVRGTLPNCKPVFMPSTCSDYRGIRNCVATVKRLNQENHPSLITI